MCNLNSLLACVAPSGKKCIFPFNYDKKTCPGPKCCNLSNNSGGSWCSTKVDANGNHVSGHWQYCKGLSCDPGKIHSLKMNQNLFFLCSISDMFITKRHTNHVWKIFRCWYLGKKIKKGFFIILS